MLTLSELFPHWIYFDNVNSARRPAGYHFFTNKPKPADRNLPQHVEAKRDALFKLLQRAILCLFTLALFILFKNDLSLVWKVLAVIIIGLGILPLYVWIDYLWSYYLTSH